MSMTNNEPEYQTSIKNRWRVGVWKQAAYRLRKARIDPKKALCLYLPGPKDLDRKAAVRHGGFHPYNLVGVDHSYEIAVNNRNAKNGQFCIQASFEDVLHNWPVNNLPTFIHADFCSGLDTAPISLLDWVVFTAARQSRRIIVCLNIQRGRDSRANLIRQGHETGYYTHVAPFVHAKTTIHDLRNRYPRMFINHPNDWSTGQVMSIEKFVTKHRGVLFLDFLRLYFSGLDGDRMLSTAAFGSYRGSRVCMDSVIFEVPHDIAGPVLLPNGEEVCSGEEPNPTVRRKIAATMAHRTMFLQRVHST